jgi:hypothetical protein
MSLAVFWRMVALRTFPGSEHSTGAAYSAPETHSRSLVFLPIV